MVERYYLIAEHRERANWVRNILNDPRVLFRVRDNVSAGTGRVVDAEREAELWAEIRALFDKKYGWSDGLIVELSRTQGLYKEEICRRRLVSRHQTSRKSRKSGMLTEPLL